MRFNAWHCLTCCHCHYRSFLGMCLPTVVCPCCCLWMPCASLRVIYLPESSHQALSSLITRPSVLSSCNWLRLQLFSFIQLCLSDSGSNFFQLCLSVWLVFLTPSGSQVNAWSLSRTAYKCKTASEQSTYKLSKFNKQTNITMLSCHADVSIINTFQCGSMPGIAWLAATVTIDHFLECVCPLLFAHAVAFGCLVPVSESFTFPSPVTRPFQAL